MGFGATTRCLLLAGLFLHAARAGDVSAPVRTSLMVGRGLSVILDEHEVAFPSRETRLRMRVPAGIDPASLAIMDPAGRARVLETRWREPASPAPPVDGVAFGAPAGSAHADTDREVEALVRSSDTRARVVEAFYTTDALDWSARYVLTVRGDIANHLEPLSADIEGHYFISNGLARTFTNARVLVRGPDRLDVERGPPLPARGFLSLDADSPLADLWRPRPPPARTPQLYTISDAVTLPGGEVTAIRFAAARRVSADRVFRFEGDRISTAPAGAPQPLRQQLSVRNERRVGLGTPLPPGWVTVIAGAGRASIRQQAQLNHTPAGGWIRVDLGPVPEVGGARRSLGRTLAKTGFTEETIELRIVNMLPSAVRVEIVEQPPAPLAWDVVRSSRSYEVVARRILMDLNVPPRSEERITYTVRLTEPEG